MEPSFLDPSQILTPSARRSVWAGLMVALSIALGAGCIDVNVIQSNVGGADGGLSTGAPCGSNDQCTSGFCVDGYCCSEACQGACTFCGPANLVGGYARAGYCLPVSQGLRDPHGVCAASTCVGSVWTPAATCDGAGACVPSMPATCASHVCNPQTNSCSCEMDADCGSGIACQNGGCGLLALGQICAVDSECASHQCVEGVCCDGACTGGCQTCTAQGSVGTCRLRSVGTSPRDPADCPVDPPSSCGLDGTCDGSGACRQYFETTCAYGTCNGAVISGESRCDGEGQCLPAPVTVCAPFACDATGDATTGSCFQSCTSNAQCATGSHCNVASGSCGVRPTSAVCTTDADCSSGHCTDGVCCNTACRGACVDCNVAGRSGTCTAISGSARDPHGICVDQGASGCGQNGTCNGLGGCADYPRDTQCLAPSCAGNILSTAGSCDGSGTCRSGSIHCDPFRCVDGACTANCQTDDDCASGSHCINGSCGAKGPGLRCQSGSECASNVCADGVCCDSDCRGSCESCNLSSSPGRCTTVAFGSPDPHGECADNGPAFCGTNGMCDGSGGCARYSLGTVCASETCAGGAYTPPSTCNLAGQCVTPDPLPCFPNVCDGTRCFASCSNDTQCAPPSICINSSCGLKSDGASCSGDTECASGTCAQGICCNSACTGACQSCALTTSLGACVNAPPHVADPALICTDQGASSCGNDGRCDGSGGCERYVAGTVCAPPNCPSGSDSFTGARLCDGLGTCLPPASFTCSPYGCGTNACKGACASDADCIAPAICNSGGACISTQTMSFSR